MGATWVNPFGLAGDSLGAQGTYCYGAVGYCTSAWGSKFIYGSGNNVGYSFLIDGIFNTNTPVMLATTWSAVSYYEHVWTPQWRTSVYGGLLGTVWGSQAIAQVCQTPSQPVGFSAGTNSMFSNTNSPGFPTNQTSPPSIINNYKGAVSNCDPNSSWWQIGTRTMWNPVPDIDIGFDLSFIRLNTAFAGTAVLGSLGTVFQANALGRPSGLYSIDNQNVYSAMFRIQRNFLY